MCSVELYNIKEFINLFHVNHLVPMTSKYHLSHRLELFRIFLRFQIVDHSSEIYQAITNLIYCNTNIHKFTKQPYDITQKYILPFLISLDRRGHSFQYLKF